MDFAMPWRFTAQSKAESPPFLETILALDAELPRLERADAGGNDDGPRRVLVLRGLQHEVTGSVPFNPAEPRYDFAQVGGGSELERLHGHVSNQVFGEHLGEPGHIEDVLLGVEGHELAAQSWKGVDDARRRPAHARVERREQAGRAATDEGYVFQLLRGH